MGRMTHSRLIWLSCGTPGLPDGEKVFLCLGRHLFPLVLTKQCLKGQVRLAKPCYLSGTSLCTTW